MTSRRAKTFTLTFSCLSLIFPLAANASHFGESSEHQASGVPATHDATAVETDTSDAPIVVESDESSFAYVPPPSVSWSQQHGLSFLMGFEGAVSHNDDSFFGSFNLRLEGTRFGVNTQLTGIRLPWDDQASADTHPIGLVNAYATYSILSTPTARLRVEAGFMAAFARDLATVGPGFGVSGYTQLLGALGTEGAAHVALYPYDQFDWNIGATLTFGRAQLHGGWRRIWLNDQGLVDGISHEEAFSGPYLGLSFTL